MFPPQEYYGEPTNDRDIGLLVHKGDKLTARVLDGHPLLPASTLSNRTLTVRKLLSPLAPRDITAIRGLGLQYPPDPSKPAQPPAVPCLFFKPSSSIAGPGDEILIPSLAEGEKNDYECELCVVIGKDAKDVKEEDALNYVAGCVRARSSLLRHSGAYSSGPHRYCVVNDVSSRGLCGKGGQWGMGKAFDCEWVLHRSWRNLDSFSRSMVSHRTLPRLVLRAWQEGGCTHAHHAHQRPTRAESVDQGPRHQGRASQFATLLSEVPKLTRLRCRCSPS